ncbi:hypothetical protein ACWDN9_21085, partial [Streptomyces nigra]
MRSLPLPLALTARLSPVVVLATAGWALSSGPDATPAPEDRTAAQRTEEEAPDAPATAAASKTYTAAPSPCGSLSEKSVKGLVPGAKAA